jgi:hypothetical protein
MSTRRGPAPLYNAGSERSSLTFIGRHLHYIVIMPSLAVQCRNTPIERDVVATMARLSASIPCSTNAAPSSTTRCCSISTPSYWRHFCTCLRTCSHHFTWICYCRNNVQVRRASCLLLRGGEGKEKGGEAVKFFLLLFPLF